MRAASLVPLLLLAAAPEWAAAQGCLSTPRFGRRSDANHISHRTDDDRRLMQVRWRRGDCEIRIDARGDFGVNADLTAFVGVEDGGYIDIEEIDGNTERRVRIIGRGRELEYRWYLDGEGGRFDVNRERWLADMILALERRTAMFVKSRVPELLRRGGPNAVLDEADRLESDYARKTYYVTLLSQVALDEPSTERMLRQAENMSSDYERSELIRAVARRPMSDRIARAAIAVANRMSSDYEKKRSLTAGLAAVTSAESRSALFQTASTMSSSYELAEVLIAAQSRFAVDSLSSEAYFRAVGRISSDYERRRTLSSLLKQKPTATNVLAGVLRTGTFIRSDHELANLLVEFARTIPVRGELRELYLAATKSISSDHEYRRTLQALLEQDRSASVANMRSLLHS
jgi:hypothetical protein